MKIKTICLLPVALSLAGCLTTTNHQFFHTNKQAYLQSQETPPLNVPPGLTGSKINNYYVIPSVPGSAAGQVSLLPPGSLAAQKASK